MAAEAAEAAEEEEEKEEEEKEDEEKEEEEKEDDATLVIGREPQVLVFRHAAQTAFERRFVPPWQTAFKQLLNRFRNRSEFAEQLQTASQSSPQS